MKQKIVGVGSVPYGPPCGAISNRGELHMHKREEYLRELETLMRFLEMDRNVQMLLL